MSEGSQSVALVTGASRGIGKAIALELASQDYRVIGTATTNEGAEKISDYLKSMNASGQGMRVNVAEEQSVSDLIETIASKFSIPTVLVNNAGITRDNLLMRMKEPEWHDVIETNLGSIYRVTKLCLKGMMRARWGRIVNISSVVGSSGNAGQVNYSASKAGMEGFTRSLAKELGSRGITVNAVAPGFIDTDMTQSLPEEQKTALLSQIPLKRLGRPEDIAEVVGFLVSDKGGYVTGETIHVNGGMYMG
ncbi:MAG: 3-oxoacyl-ACP reductase FabG [Gammaproteobacteria bacterium]|nr:3-oxoacyl-ACP reductase FabG [Gammaproteobacteria bacterium]